ncbi:MAG: UDP-N-acetylmuramate dehydrogenase [Burkholderiaceae bacterium]|nr:UDP-N-acetylmuramate dehydrogenase [Burkholderiaceae bacterium]
MQVEHNVSLQALNSFGIAARAAALVRVRGAEDVRAVLADPELGPQPKFVLGAGSNIVLRGDVRPVVLKVEARGRRILDGGARHMLVEAAAGESWHDLVCWMLAQGLYGLENLALIPGTVGAAPVQNIGAYGLELQDRFDSLDAIDLRTGKLFTLNAAQCGFGYRDSVFKHALAGQALILRVRLALPKAWQPVLGYQDLERKMQETGIARPSARQVFDWVVAIRRAKLPDPAQIGSAGSFFKNPTVTAEQCQDIIGRDPKMVHYPMPDGSFKLAAGWLIDACGWRGKRMGNAGVHERQALVLINAGGPEQPATGGEVMTLARAIQTSVYERFGIRLEPEPVLV